MLLLDCNSDIVLCTEGHSASYHIHYRDGFFAFLCVFLHTILLLLFCFSEKSAQNFMCKGGGEIHEKLPLFEKKRLSNQNLMLFIHSVLGKDVSMIIPNMKQTDYNKKNIFFKVIHVLDIMTNSK